jgi:hypothetical protein
LETAATRTRGLGGPRSPRAEHQQQNFFARIGIRSPMCATAPEKFHFLFFCYCHRVKKGYSMGDRAPTTGGVHNV